jgi:hypothetical protein
MLLFRMSSNGQYGYAIKLSSEGYIELSRIVSGVYDKAHPRAKK